MVSMRQSRKGQSSSVTVSFWYYEYMSSKICFEFRGLPLKSLPLIHSRGVKQYSSQLMQMLYLRKSSSRYSNPSSPLIYKKPHSFPLLSIICCSVNFRIRLIEVAGATRYCFSAGSNLLDLLNAFCHFHPKLVNWSPACRNCSGESMPLASQSFSEGVNLELKKLLMPPSMIMYDAMRVNIIYSSQGKKRPPWGLNPRPLSQEPNALPTELDGLLTTTLSSRPKPSSFRHTPF